ncbi:GPI inositol-deacylase [Microplitis demolitor]|uniref:GPI inositol-deacylase n=1 Tax=Microplitis demolitor TaxID=69319 RepID=UPI0004CD1D56|nr:GPI inositol-deacylase [Microplitis demolitor]
MVKLIIYTCLLSLCLISFGIYILGVAHYVTDLEENTCDMTYMFEYPQYVRIKLDNDIEREFNKFSLYAYGEGHATEKLRRMKFSGIPVLFIPGNAGSHEQVRSIASVSLRMSLKRRTPFHFDYFTISFSKGLSALYGGILEQQKSFTRHCIDKIFTLYDHKVDQVVLIGHSMGGIIAKSVLLHDKTNSSLASILITLASPHTPNIAFDKTFIDFYHRINSRAKRIKDMGTSVVSIGGGPRDLQVTSSQIIDPLADLNVLTTAIPNVWRSQDHLSILWCKQLIIVLVRGLFDCVDATDRVPRITSDPDVKSRAFSYHLSSRFADKHFGNYEKITNFESGKWIEVTSPHYTYTSNDNRQSKGRQSNKITYLIIPIDLESAYSYISFDAINLEISDWIFVCSASVENSNKKCKSGLNLTNLTRLSPDYLFQQRKTVDIKFADIISLSEVTHFVVKISNDAEKNTPVVVHIDKYYHESRNTHIDATGVYWLPSPVKTIFTGYKYSVINIEPGSLRYHVDVSGVDDGVSFLLESITDGENNNMPGYVVIEMQESCNSSNSVIIQFFTLTEKNIARSQILRMQTNGDYKKPDSTVKIILSFDPKFSYKIVVQRAGLIDRAANFARDRWFRLYPTAIGLLLLIIATRMDNTKHKELVTIGFTSIVVIYSGIYFEIFITMGLLLVLSVATCCAVVFSGSMVHNVTARFLARALARFPAAWYSWLLRQGLDHLPFIASLILFIIISSSCAAVAMLLSVVIYFLKLTRMYEDYLEELFMASLRAFMRKFKKPSDKSKVKDNKSDPKKSNDVDPTTNIINHLLLFMTWYLTAISAIPTTLVWAKDFSYETHLATEDTSMFISWIVLTGWGSLGLVKISPPSSGDNKFRLKTIAMFQRIVGWILLWIAQSKNISDYQWMIPPIVAISITRIVLTPFFVKRTQS